MPPAVPQEFLEDALAMWKHLRRWTDINSSLCALQSHPLYCSLHSERDPHSLRIARRVVEVLDCLSLKVEATVDDCNMTPRGALLALASGVYLCLCPISGTSASCINERRVSSSLTAAFAVADDWMTRGVAYRSISGTMIMEGLHVLTCPGVQLRMQMAIARLRERMKEELVGGDVCDAYPHTPSELKALRVTKMLLDDFEDVYRRLLATFPCARAMGSSHVPVALFPVIHELYYQVCEWVLEVKFAEKENPGALVQSFDPKKLTVMLHRPDCSSPWGLRFNSHGKLSGVNALVRSASIAGERLHRLIGTTKVGVSIVSYNLKAVDFSNLDALQATEKFNKMSEKPKRLYLKLQMDPDVNPSIEQLAFFTVSPFPSSGKEQQQRDGNEETIGHCATLVLHRNAWNISWGLAVSRDLLIVNAPEKVLSPNAEAFLAAHHRRLRIGGINGVEVTSPVQVEALSCDINTIVLDLYLVPPSSTSCQQLQEASGADRDMWSNPTVAVALTTIESLRLNSSDEQRQKLSVSGKEETNTTRRDDLTGLTQRSGSNKRTNSGAEELASCASIQSPVNNGRTMVVAPQEASSASNASVGVQRLSPADIAALKEKPFVPPTAMSKTARPEVKVARGAEQWLHNGEAPAENQMSLEARSLNRAVTTSEDAPAVLKHSSTATTVGGDKVANPVLSFDVEPVGTASVSSPPSSCPSDAAVGVLVFPNKVTLELLTPHEMVVRRQFAHNKWDISLETVGQDLNKVIRVTGLPPVADQQQKHHPFHRLFYSQKGEWRIASVNGTPASKLPELIEIMKHALQMRIKFHRRW